MKSGIYEIICAATGKAYIGSASSIETRWAMHRHYLRKNKHIARHLQRAWNKYGEAGFEFRVLEFVETDRLIEREQFHLDLRQPFGCEGFNTARIAGRTTGVKRTPAQIEAMAARFRGKTLSAERRAQISASNRGRKHRPESIEKMRQARLKNNHQVGRPLTDKQKAALHRSGENHPWFGRHHTEETRRKLSVQRTHAVVQCDDTGTAIRVWVSAKEAATALGLRNADTIYRSVNSDYRTAGGWRWRRAP